MNTALAKLSRREREVAKLVAEGLTSKEIGQRLFISERTAEGHVDQIRNKLGFRTRAQIAAWVATEVADPIPAVPSAPTALQAEHAATQKPVPRPPRDGRQPGALVLANRWIWLGGGAMAMVATGILIVTVLIPAITAVTTHGPIIETFVGTGIGSISPDNDLARSTNLIAPSGVVFNRAAELYFADGNRIRVVRHDDRIQTVAGTTGVSGFAGDGESALEAKLSIAADKSAESVGLVVDAQGDVFFSDTGNDRVREITVDHKIITVAGSGAPGHSFVAPPPADIGDGKPGVNAVLSQPRGLALDSLGDLFIADTGDNRVRMLDLRTGIISTVAGDGDLGWSGDGHPAGTAELSAPEGLALDAQGDLFIADAGNERIRKVSNGLITTLAGDGTSGFSGDGGAATKAQLSLPLGLAVDSRGNLYIADSGNNRVRKVDLGGVITTVAGSGGAGFSGDSHAAAAATLNLPVALAVSDSNDLYIADSANNRIRVVRLGIG